MLARERLVQNKRDMEAAKNGKKRGDSGEFGGNKKTQG